MGRCPGGPRCSARCTGRSHGPKRGLAPASVIGGRPPPPPPPFGQRTHPQRTPAVGSGDVRRGAGAGGRTPLPILVDPSTSHAPNATPSPRRSGAMRVCTVRTPRWASFPSRRWVGGAAICVGVGVGLNEPVWAVWGVQGPPTVSRNFRSQTLQVLVALGTGVQVWPVRTGLPYIRVLPTCLPSLLAVTCSC